MMNETSQLIVQQLFDYLNASPTATHATANACHLLEEKGFLPLDEGEPWNLKPEKGYYVQRNQSALLAFRLGNDNSQYIANQGFKIITAHTDSPAPKLKMHGAAMVAGQLRVPVEIYGGLIHGSWLDRPLSMAGRVACSNAETGQLSLRRIDLRQPIAVIPNLAIHLGRDINRSNEYNPQQHLAAVFGQATSEALLLQICHAAQCGLGDLLDMDLFLYDSQPATRCGIDGDLISSPRLDNLSSCHAALTALLQASPADSIQVMFLADNEEVGSRSAQGAQSSFLRTTLERITSCMKGTSEDVFRALAHSAIVSVDSAHGLHPNYPEKHDSGYAPLLNHGIVIKSNASLNYSSNAATAAAFRNLCKCHQIPVQDFINRSDMPCGSTIGPTCSALLGVPGVDIGTPLLAMHSCRELGGVDDHVSLIRALAAFYGSR